MLFYSFPNTPFQLMSNNNNNNNNNNTASLV
jgi:hypothetical protein